MTFAEILAAVTEIAKLGTGSLDFWKQLHATAATEIDKALAHDAKLKPAPDPGPRKGTTDGTPR